MKLYVVRHAHAGARSSWEGSDQARPLSKKGRRQAEGVAEQLCETGVRRLVSSPARRCLQTLEPLAGRLGLEVEADARLAEGARAADALELAEELREAEGLDAIALCSHGDVIPELLRSLRDRGTRIHGPLVWPKASTWVVGSAGDRWASGRYLAPPGKS